MPEDFGLIYIFSNFGLRDSIDLIIATVFIYLALVFLRETRLFFIFTALVVFAGISYFSDLFGFTVTREIFQPFLTFFILIIVIVFQREIRKFFEWFAIPGRRMSLRRNISRSVNVTGCIVQAISELVSSRTGALIVFEGEIPIEHSIEGGERLDGKISLPILASIFDPSSPGHDGAVIIAEEKIKYFGSHLPLAQDYKNLDRAGTRHRAALGITEETDALVIVVSEETGVVSAAKNGSIKKINRDECRKCVGDFMREHATRESKKFDWKPLIQKHRILKISSFLLALILWVLLETYN